MREILTASQLAAEFARRPGLIPVNVDAAGGTVEWLDLQQYHCYHGFFSDSIAEYHALSRGAPYRCASGLEALDAIDFTENCIPPSGFIFHAGRCGSTALVKVLARCRAHVVFGEAAAHNQIWGALPEHDEDASRLYRKLLLAMGRRRLSSHRAHIIKFTSYNVMRLEFIRRAFPDTPALFLFRDPGPTLASWHRGSPGWLGKDAYVGKVWNRPEAAVEDFFRAALDTDDRRFGLLDHRDLSAETLPAILDFFGLNVSEADFRQMASEFAWDSKQVKPAKFVPRSNPVVPVPESLASLYRRLHSRSLSWRQ
ncbi:MAG TPA: hypothetical protein VHB50_04295 [Bryobacteraceae bacterium]|nr:hypothetical protein [Bryobacteraceae bacterium]